MIVCIGGDHEYSIFDSTEDHAGWAPGPDCELHDAELMVSLEGHRGHYLGRDFIYEAMFLLDNDNATGQGDDRALADRYENEWDAEIEPGWTVAEHVDEMVQTYESALDAAGYLTEWNDGVMIVKVGDEINE